MAGDTSSHGLSKHTADDGTGPVDRRGALKLLGSSVAGGISLGAATLPAAAEDYTYLERVSRSGQDTADNLCGNAYVHIGVGTELGWTASDTDDGVHRNIFHFVTAGGAEDASNDPIRKLDHHRFSIDGCGAGIETSIDPNDTGVYPADGWEVWNNLRDVAKTAVTSAFAPLGMASNGLAYVAEIQDAYEKTRDCGAYYKEFNANRRRRWDMAPQDRVTTQGEFRLEWPIGESGWVQFETTLAASNSGWCNGHSDRQTASVTNGFDIWCGADGHCVIW
mgnify:CR=1 FL=1